MINVGDAKYPNHRDKACVTATRFLERTSKAKSPAVRDALTRRRRNRPDLFRQDVEMIRVPTSEVEEHSNMLSVLLEERDNNTVKLLQVYESAQIAQKVEDVALFNHRQFMGYYVHFEMYTKEEASAMWLAASTDLRLAKKDSGGNTIVPVTMPVRLQSIQSVAKRQRFEEIMDIKEGDSPEALKEQVRNFMNHKMDLALIGTLGDGALQPGGTYIAPEKPLPDKTNVIVPRGSQAKLASMFERAAGSSASAAGSKAGSACSDGSTVLTSLGSEGSKHGIDLALIAGMPVTSVQGINLTTATL